MKKLLLIITLMLLAVPLLTTQPVAAQQNTQWSVEYFNNPYLIGPAAATQQVNSPIFNWGAGSPAANIGVDGFTARITTDIHFTAGTYRFYLLSDDAAHLYVDFQSRINNWDTAQVGQVLSADITLSSGSYHIQVDYRENQGNAYMYLDWENVADGISGPTFTNPLAPNPGITNAAWTAEYFNNPSHVGIPQAVFGESTPTHNWGINTPVTGLPADNFSARWTTSQNFDGTPYQISVRADDGVRVYVDNALVINQWGLANGQTYTATVTPAAGNRVVVVEYYEAAGVAFLEYNLARIGISTPTQPTITNAYLVVNTGRLNVRSIPAVNGSIILTKINQSEAYNITGRNTDSSWWQINVNGVTGWVSAPFVQVYNVQNVPITNGVTVAAPPTTGYIVTASANINVRSGPSAAFGRVGLMPHFRQAQVIGRNATSTWWQVNYNGTIGWVSASYAIIQPDANLMTIPILG